MIGSGVCKLTVPGTSRARGPDREGAAEHGRRHADHMAAGPANPVGPSQGDGGGRGDDRYDERPLVGASGSDQRCEHEEGNENGCIGRREIHDGQHGPRRQARGDVRALEVLRPPSVANHSASVARQGPFYKDRAM